MVGYLILEDGNSYKGELLNNYMCAGEVVFNTGMTGYQEILTDPSYKGQIITMTYPLIGNYGVSKAYTEKAFLSAEGFIVSEISEFDSNYMSERSLKAYLTQNKIPALYNIDTRKLVKHIREIGTIKGYIVDEFTYQKYLDSDKKIDFKGLSKEIKCSVDSEYVVDAVSTKDIYTVGDGDKKVVLIDCGSKENIINHLVKRKCTVIVVPYNTDYKTILSLKPNGVFISNGPGDPKSAIEITENIKNLIGKLPVFGICLGHQLIALSLGCDTFKLKYGHRGCNHPVKDLRSNKVYITSQNHGYSVDDKTISVDIEITHINLNDGTVEGIRHKSLPIMSVQYHPEAAPGPRDSSYIFDEFLEVL
jgi:carbamoyl-phosphate synthase small subunit